MISDRTIAEVAALQESRRREYWAERKRAEQRDQLAGIIEGETGMAFTSKTAADRILSAGYQPPPRVIDTTEELDALREDAVIRLGESVYQHGGTWWMTPGSIHLLTSSQILDEADGTDIVVLWETEEWNR